MRKFTLYTLLFVGILASCKKSNSGSSGTPHVTATVDGTAKTFNISPIALQVTLGSSTAITVTGVASTSTGEVISIAISNQPGYTAIKAGTYSDTSSNFTLSATYAPTLAYTYSAGTGFYQTAQGSGVTIANHFKFVINSIDSTAIAGTFSGDFYANGDPSAAKKTIANGDFYAKIHH